MKRIKIIPVICQRCGKTLHTTNRSIYGADKLKKQIGVLCSGCADLEETVNINKSVGMYLNNNYFV